MFSLVSHPFVQRGVQVKAWLKEPSFFFFFDLSDWLWSEPCQVALESSSGFESLCPALVHLCWPLESEQTCLFSLQVLFDIVLGSGKLDLRLHEVGLGQIWHQIWVGTADPIEWGRIQKSWPSVFRLFRLLVNIFVVHKAYLQLNSTIFWYLESRW